MKHPVDVHVGKRVRHRRWMVGMTQQQLAEKVGIKFQQIQKYETGMNRVSASRLWDIAQILDVPVSFFFDDMTDDTAANSPRKVRSGSPPTEYEEKPNDPMARRETLELVRAYYNISNVGVRKRITEMVKSVSQALPGDA